MYEYFTTQGLFFVVDFFTHISIPSKNSGKSHIISKNNENHI